MDERERRLTQNEALFREINESVESAAQHQGADDHIFEFVCECANTECTFMLTLPLATYEKVRADPRQFVVLPNHYMPEVEELVADEERYWVVRKTGEAAEQVDPRSR